MFDSKTFRSIVAGEGLTFFGYAIFASFGPVSKEGRICVLRYVISRKTGCNDK